MSGSTLDIVVWEILTLRGTDLPRLMQYLTRSGVESALHTMLESFLIRMMQVSIMVTIELMLCGYPIPGNDPLLMMLLNGAVEWSDG